MNAHVKLEGAEQHRLVKGLLHDRSLLVPRVMNQLLEASIVVAPDSNASAAKVIIGLGNPIALPAGLDLLAEQVLFCWKTIGCRIPVIVAQGLGEIALVECLV